MPLRVLACFYRLVLAGGLLVAAPSARATTSADRAPAMASIGLARGSVQTVRPIARTTGETSVYLSLDGRDVELVLEPYSMRRQYTQAMVEGPVGVLTPIDLPPSKTYRGTVRGAASGVAAVTIDGPSIRARVILDDGSDWYVQPIPDDRGGGHAIYRGEDVAEAPGTCAADGAPAGTREPLAAPEAQSSGCVDAEIAIEAEYAYYAWNGGSSTQTINDIDAVMNAVELIYARDAKIGYKITQYLIQTTNGKYSSSDANTKMNQFQSWWNANQGSVPRDLAHLMTGPLNYGQLGVAYYSVICNTSQAYGISYSYWTTNWTNRVAVTAHELGHNWGATHCNSQPDCYVMCTNIGLCAGDMTRFSPSTIREIETYRNLSGSCLAAGNGTPTALNPTARDDRAVALRGTAATIKVLANDFDPNCQTISVAGVASPTANGGTVAISGDNVIYTPAATFLGEDTFTYAVRDQGGAQSTATVTVDVEDYKPADVATGAVSGLQVRYYHVPPLDGYLGSMPTLSNPYRIETVPTLSFPTTDDVVGESGLKDRVAARCTGSINLPATATYTFYLTASDGAKLYIDDVLRVDNDGIHGMLERAGSVSLSAGAHTVRVDYYEETGTAGLLLEIAGGGIPRQEIPASMWASPGVRIEYYQLDSSLVPPFRALVPEKTQLISTINYPFSWGNFAGSGRAVDVGAVFEGYLTVPSDDIYYFEITSEDGSMLTIGDKLVVDNNGYHNRVSASGGRALRAGAHKFRLDYFARDGGCALLIQVWSSTLAKQTVPSSWWSHVPTFHVPTDYATISAAVAAATPNSMVWVAAGTYTGSANRNLNLGNKNIALVGGGGSELTILDAQDAGRLFTLSNHTQSGAVIEGFSLCHGTQSSGASGGAMLFDNSTLTVRDCTIKANANPGPGGALGFTGASSPTFENCVVSGNHSGASGGAVYADGGSSPTFVGCTLSGNFADLYGGGIYAGSGGYVSMERTILWGNSAASGGSEAWTGDPTGTVDFSCSDVRSTDVGGDGTELFGANTIVSDPLFCVPAPGTLAPTTGGSYRVVSSSPVLSAAGACGSQIGARGPGCSSGAVTAVETPLSPVKPATALDQNVPNPFNPETRISFSVPQRGRVALRIYDPAGRVVATLVDRDMPSGQHVVTWRGTNDRNRRVASGVYFYQLRCGGELLTRSMVLLK